MYTQCDITTVTWVAKIQNERVLNVGDNVKKPELTDICDVIYYNHFGRFLHIFASSVIKIIFLCIIQHKASCSYLIK